jgi:group I intron endonuclease
MADRITGIYKITSPTGRVYIGQSVNVNARFKRYKDLNCLSQRKLYRSLLKYGCKAHTFQIIHELPGDASKEVLDTYERLYIEVHNNCGYKMLNIKSGGSNGALSRETRIRQSISLKGRERKELPIDAIKDQYAAGASMSELAVKYKISHNTLLRRLNKEIGAVEVQKINRERKLLSLNKVARKFEHGVAPWNKGITGAAGNSNSFYGKTHTAEAKSKMREHKEKQLICLNNGIEYQSAKAAAQRLGLHEASVAKVARGYQKQHKGYIFKYK